MNSSAKQILIGWIYRRIGFLKRGMKKQIKPLAAILRFLDFSTPIPSFRAQREIFLALCSFLLPSQMDSRFLLSHIRHYPLLQERSLDFARDDVAEVAFSKHIRCTLREINPSPYRHSERSEKSSLHSALSCSFRRWIPIFRCLTYGAIPVCQKDPSTSLGMTIREALSKHIRCTLREINPFPHTVISSAARNLPCTPRFLAPFAKGFPFSAITHTTLSLPARKIEGFARDDVA